MSSRFMSSWIAAVIAQALVSGMSSAHAAIGSGTSGGGSGCLADFMRSTYQVGQWLRKNGQKLKPGVSAEAFWAAVNPDEIKFTSGDLTYKGNPVDAYFDGNVIEVRCDRLTRQNETTQDQVVAHEIFRKMGIEGDAYEISRQISILNPARAKPSTCVLHFGYDYEVGPYAQESCDGKPVETSRLRGVEELNGAAYYLMTYNVAVAKVISSYTDRGYAIIDKEIDSGEIDRSYTLSRH